MKKYLPLIIVLVFLSVTTFGREGIYLEFKITSSSMNGTSKVYSADGDTRSDIYMTSPAMPNPVNIITLALHNTPGKAYNINVKDKTYTETDANTAKEYDSEDNYEITVLGKEKTNGYNCTHINVLYKNSHRTSEMWLSKDITGYNDYIVVKNKYLGGSKFFNVLKEKGAEGFVVRMLINGRNNEHMQMDLVTAERRNIDGSLLTLDGYTKVASNTIGNGGVDVQAMQKMTPEEQKKYIEQLKEKYQQSH